MLKSAPIKDLRFAPAHLQLIPGVPFHFRAVGFACPKALVAGNRRPPYSNAVGDKDPIREIYPDKMQEFFVSMKDWDSRIETHLGIA